MDKVAKSLPVEDITWLISTHEDCYAEDSDGEEIAQRRVVVADARQAILAISYKPHDQLNNVTHVEQTLRDAIQQPFSGKPRRPMHVTFRNGPCLSDAVLTQLGVSSVTDEAECGCSWADKPSNLRTCHKCRRRGDPELFFACDKCGTVVYCSKECLAQDRFHPVDLHGHDAWCAKMKGYMQMSTQLAQLPFSYTSETTSETFGRPEFRQFLQRYGVLGQGLWQRELPQKCPKHMPHFGDNESGPSPYVLSQEAAILCETAKTELSHPLEDWESYHSWRGLNLDSPIAILLSMPLTVYHIITLLPKHYPERNLTNLSYLKIHVIGAEKEADMVTVFRELGVLLPHLTIDLLLIGPEISKKVCGRVVEMGNVKVTIQKGLYHAGKNATPDIVIGLNAGLGAYMTWGGTLCKLKDQRTPAFFTDYCQYSCECAKGPVEGLKVGTISDIHINPFRSPIRRYCEDHTMPWYSNGFIFSLQYAHCAV